VLDVPLVVPAFKHINLDVVIGRQLDLDALVRRTGENRLDRRIWDRGLLGNISLFAVGVLEVFGDDQWMLTEQCP
jgi:hypothetical protein